MAIAHVLLTSYLVILAYALFLLCSYVDQQRNTHPVFPHLQDLGWPIAGSLVFVCLQRAFQVFCQPWAVAVIEKKTKHSEVVYRSKLTRFGSAIFKFIFFVCLSFYSYVYTLANAEWTPPSLFGSGSIKNCWGVGNAGKEMRPMEWHFWMFYQVAFSYHVSELIFQIVYEMEKPDFPEMFAHHATTCFLILASFLANLNRIGSLVLIVHYVSDIPVYGCKIFVDTRWSACSAFFLVVMLASWGYLRLWCFPYEIIRSTLSDAVDMLIDWGDSADTLWMAFNVALSLLFCLHCYWYYCALQIGYKYAFHGEAKDTQANLGVMDEKVGAKEKSKSS